MAGERLTGIFDIASARAPIRKHWRTVRLIYPCPAHRPMTDNWQGLLEEAGSAEELSRDLSHDYYDHCTFSSKMICPNEVSNGQTRNTATVMIEELINPIAGFRLAYRQAHTYPPPLSKP